MAKASSVETRKTTSLIGSDKVEGTAGDEGKHGGLKHFPNFSNHPGNPESGPSDGLMDKDIPEPGDGDGELDLLKTRFTKGKQQASRFVPLSSVSIDGKPSNSYRKASRQTPTSFHRFNVGYQTMCVVALEISAQAFRN